MAAMRDSKGRFVKGHKAATPKSENKSKSKPKAKSKPKSKPRAHAMVPAPKTIGLGKTVVVVNPSEPEPNPTGSIGSVAAKVGIGALGTVGGFGLAELSDRVIPVGDVGQAAIQGGAGLLLGGLVGYFLSPSAGVGIAGSLLTRAGTHVLAAAGAPPAAPAPAPAAKKDAVGSLYGARRRELPSARVQRSEPESYDPFYRPEMDFARVG